MTAIALKTKAAANTQHAVNTEAIEQTKQAVEDKFSGVYVPRPANVERPKLTQRKAIK